MKRALKVLGLVAVCLVVPWEIRSCRLNLMADDLFKAAGDGNLKEVRRLLDAGADPARPTTLDESTTALQAARSGGHEEVAKLLESRIKDRK